MKANRIWLGLFYILLASPLSAESVITGLLNRILPGESSHFIIEKQNSDKDFFELEQRDSKVVVRGNNDISIAVGIDWYLKYYAGIQLTWNNMKAKLPRYISPITQKERHETSLNKRYYLNYCTLSYSMAFWDWNRWEKELDWMALHGINLSLMTVGTDAVWHSVLAKLDYNKKEIDAFIAGPAFQAWWLMNNLEGWGGPNPDSWYRRQSLLARQIMKRMREYGIEPVLPGYSGMLPHDAANKLGVKVADPGTWCGFNRPAFLQPSDAQFSRIANLYYAQMNRIVGKANYYSMDPFHEGGNTDGVDFKAAGGAIMKAMKDNNPKSIWVVQAWGDNPRPAMIKSLKAGDMIVLDLYSDGRPQCDERSLSFRKEGFLQHDWLYCMLLNFGANVGLYGKMNHVIDEFYKMKNSKYGQTLRGVGLTMEGIENNPVMYELLCELPWRDTLFDSKDWLKGYAKARYGSTCKEIDEAWLLLGASAYNCPFEYSQQGTTESIFCARPAENIRTVSTWADSHIYYDADDIVKAARLLLAVASNYRGNSNFEYDLLDVIRQAIADKGRITHLQAEAAFKAKDRIAFDRFSSKFLHLLDLQNELLSVRPEFCVATYLNAARSLGTTQEEKDLYEWNARTQITIWGTRKACDEGGLHDYAHKEWSGLLNDFYKPRWKAFFDMQIEQLEGKTVQPIDYFSLEESWTRQHQPYQINQDADVVQLAKRVFELAGF